ncbi:hypothetical protein M8J76_014912 [Diaphorina citri]|nr:hypothetical protein M8J76_014912 [Diaphorina citri]
MKRVVVTGLGIVSPVGTTRQSAWNAIKEGKACVSPLSEPEYSKLPCKIAARIEGLDLTAQFTQSKLRMIDLSDVLSSNNALQGSYNKLSPYFVTRDAFRLIQGGHADVMIAGAAESCISQLSIAAFCRVRALATQFNNEPAQASRPFDKRRDGFVMGEGSAILVLEELDHALARSANIYAEIIGYGMSGDGHHLTSPREDGRGALLAMTRALIDANLSPGDISYINAHATSTPLGDVIELKAIGSLFPAQRLMVSSTKGAHGHLLGAAGNLESAFTILAVHEGLVPPNVNLEDPCEEAGGYECPTAVTEWKTDGRRVALKNSFGFGD